MNVARRLALIVSFFTWLFAWSLLRDVRARFDGGDLGTIPPWLVGILGVALLVTIATTVSAAIRLPVWPWCAVASAVFVVAGVIGAHFAKLKAAADALARLGERLPGGATLGAAVRDAIHTGALHTAFFLVAPAVLLASGLYGWFRGPRTLFVTEHPHAG